MSKPTPNANAPAKMEVTKIPAKRTQSEKSQCRMMSETLTISLGEHVVKSSGELWDTSIRGETRKNRVNLTPIGWIIWMEMREVKTTDRVFLAGLRFGCDRSLNRAKLICSQRPARQTWHFYEHYEPPRRTFRENSPPHYRGTTQPYLPTTSTMSTTTSVPPPAPSIRALPQTTATLYGGIHGSHGT